MLIISISALHIWTKYFYIKYLPTPILTFSLSWTDVADNLSVDSRHSTASLNRPQSGPFLLIYLMHNMNVNISPKLP